MKRMTMVMMMLGLMLLVGGQAAADSRISVVVNGEEISADVLPIVREGRVLIPLRVVMEELGADVAYSQTTKTVTVTKPAITLLLPIGSKTARINGAEVEMDVPAMVVNSRTMVPLRFVSQTLGCSVQWQESAKCVLINALQQHDPRQVEREIFRLVNEMRLKKNLQPLVWMDELAELACRHSQDMAENNYFSHTSPSEGNPQERAKAAGLPGTAENIAAGYQSAAEIFQAWIDSPSHRANILDPKNCYIGIGYFQEQDENDPYDGVYCTQEFIKGETVLLDPGMDEIVRDKQIEVKGYTLADEVDITVYKLLDNQTFSEKYTVEFAVKDGAFHGEMVLSKGEGLYAIQVSDYDLRYFTYK